jgi:DNA topoisomerase-1
VKHGATNATIPKGTDSQAVTLEQAIALLAEREAKGGGGKKKPARGKGKAPAKKAGAKKAAAPASAAPIDDDEAPF